MVQNLLMEDLDRSCKDLDRSCKDLDRSCKDHIPIHELPEKKRARKSSKSSETVLDGADSTKIGKCASQSFKRKRIILKTNDQLDSSQESTKKPCDHNDPTRTSVCGSAPFNTNQVHHFSEIKNHSQRHEIENLIKKIQELETSVQKLSSAEWGTEWRWASGDPPSYIS